mmetsp:Transcript_100301/g.214924  ORF Transcript_100301/g.214924 Transcript_100301/m.214924 type:complete len:236 (+) Transcript_100301:45-752(+)
MGSPHPAPEVLALALYASPGRNQVFACWLFGLPEVVLPPLSGEAEFGACGPGKKSPAWAMVGEPTCAWIWAGRSCATGTSLSGDTCSSVMAGLQGSDFSKEPSSVRRAWFSSFNSPFTLNTVPGLGFSTSSTTAAGLCPSPAAPAAGLTGTSLSAPAEVGASFPGAADVGEAAASRGPSGGASADASAGAASTGASAGASPPKSAACSAACAAAFASSSSSASESSESEASSCAS